MTVRDYRDLKIWQLAMDLTEDVYRLCSRFPKSELYALTSQIQRAAVSLPSNIAEGHARGSQAEFLRYLHIAAGSLAELETQLVLAQRLGYVQPSQLNGALGRASELGKMLNGMQKSIKAHGAD